MKFLVFADTNVFLDALLERSAGKDCKEILRFAERKNIKLLTSSASIQTIIYILQKAKLKNDAIILLIENLLKLVTLTSPDESIIKAALHAGFNDLEDAIQYFTAKNIKGIDYFVTSNIKDFKKSNADMTIMTPLQLKRILQKN